MEYFEELFMECLKTYLWNISTVIGGIFSRVIGGIFLRVFGGIFQQLLMNIFNTYPRVIEGIFSRVVWNIFKSHFHSTSVLLLCSNITRSCEISNMSSLR